MTVSEKISKIMHDWEATGKIGTSRPKNKRAARRQAVAIAMQMAREGKLTR